MSEDLPLDDPRWVPLEAPHRLLTQRTGNRHLAAQDLTALLATRVRSMRRYFGRLRDLSRPDLERELLPFSFWAEHSLSSWSDGLFIRPVRSSQPIPAAGLYAWKPDLDTVGLTDAPATAAASVTTEPVEGPKIRLAKELMAAVYPNQEWREKGPVAVRKDCEAMAKAKKVALPGVDSFARAMGRRT